MPAAPPLPFTNGGGFQLQDALNKVFGDLFREIGAGETEVQLVAELARARKGLRVKRPQLAAVADGALLSQQLRQQIVVAEDDVADLRNAGRRALRS